MQVLSLFDGISCGMVALERAALDVDIYVAYEIDPYAVKVSKSNYPAINHCGDVFNGNFTEYKGFDLLIGGSPCTHWSISKKDRETNADGIGFKLFMQYKRALVESGCKHFLYENNNRIHKDIQKLISDELGVQPIMINSSLVSGQRRERLYWTNIPNVTQPKDKNIVLEDFLTYEMLKNYNGATFVRNKESPRERVQRLYKLGHTGTKDNQSTRVYSIKGKSQTIASQAGGGGAKTGLYLWNDDKVYSLGIKAVEQLQTLPTGYTKAICESRAVTAVGNGWTVDVISHILSHLKEGHPCKQ